MIALIAHLSTVKGSLCSRGFWCSRDTNDCGWRVAFICEAHTGLTSHLLATYCTSGEKQPIQRRYKKHQRGLSGGGTDGMMVLCACPRGRSARPGRLVQIKGSCCLTPSVIFTAVMFLPLTSRGNLNFAGSWHQSRATSVHPVFWKGLREVNKGGKEGRRLCTVSRHPSLAVACPCRWG